MWRCGALGEARAFAGNGQDDIEVTLSQGVRAFGLRRCRYIGLVETLPQHILTAAAINSVRVGAWLEGQQHAQTRKSTFVKLITQPLPT